VVKVDVFPDSGGGIHGDYSGHSRTELLVLEITLVVGKPLREIWELRTFYTSYSKEEEVSPEKELERKKRANERVENEVYRAKMRVTELFGATVASSFDWEEIVFNHTYPLKED
jgi:hypothetical protein